LIYSIAEFKKKLFAIWNTLFLLLSELYNEKYTVGGKYEQREQRPVDLIGDQRAEHLG
jgi:hypothetical protein